MIVASSQEQLSVSIDGEKDSPLLSTMRALPGTSAGTRGTTADIVIIEEAGFVDEDTFFDSVAPLISVRNTAVWAISTPPKDTTNYFLTLFEAKLDGEPIFRTVTVERICNECRQQGITDCPHLAHTAPKWLSGKRKQMLKALYSNCPSRYMREIGGLSIAEDISVFPGTMVDDMLARERVKEVRGRDQQIVFISIDPSGGGFSKTAICSFYWDLHQNLVICGLDSIDLSDGVQETETRGMIRHLTALRNFPMLRNSYFVLIIEANHCHKNASTLWLSAHALRRELTKPVYLPPKTGPGQPTSGMPKVGVWTTAANKERMQRHTFHFLQEGRIQIHKHLVGGDETLEEFGRQMKNYRRIVKQVGVPGHTTEKVGYSGKGTSGSNDDMAVAFQLGVLFSVLYLKTADRTCPGCSRMNIQTYIERETEEEWAAEVDPRDIMQRNGPTALSIAQSGAKRRK
jgi:hypothetical protein